MSKQEDLKIGEKICVGIWRAQKQLFERKAKLKESVVFADANGLPIRISAEEALVRLLQAHPEVQE